MDESSIEPVKDYRTRDERLSDRFEAIEAKLASIEQQLKDTVHIEQLNTAIKQHNESQ